jgi:ribonuclease T1
MRLLTFLSRICRKKFLLLFLAMAALASCSERHSKTSEGTTHQPVNLVGKEASKTRQSVIPDKAYEVLRYIQKYHRAPKDHVGGKKFGNYEQLLPQKTARGKKVKYQEWDVNPKREGSGRGAERIVTSDDERAWYTADHYRSFIEMH